MTSYPPVTKLSIHLSSGSCCRRGRCGRLPDQPLVEDEREQRCWGVTPVGDGLGRLVPQPGAACGGRFGRAGGLAQMPQDCVHGRRLRDEGGDAHISPAEHAAQGQDLIDADAGQQQGPEEARRRALGALQGIGRAGLGGELLGGAACVRRIGRRHPVVAVAVDAPPVSGKMAGLHPL